MPDHMHMLVEGLSESATLRPFLSHFKQISGYSYKKRHGRSLWQPNYFERVLRGEEGTEQIARYILGNPIRAGLTTSWGEYEYAGSDVFDYKNM